MLIDPLNPRCFNRNISQLEHFLVFGCFVAGKNSKTQSKKVDELYLALNSPVSIFSKLREMSEEEILNILKTIKSGQYSRLCKCLYQLSRSSLDLKTCTCEELEQITGIGMKTSRFFVTYSRSDCEYAVLDTHILKWLNEKGISAPKSTPTNKKLYTQLENKFLQLCKEENKKPYELDFEIWKNKQTSWK